MENTYQDLITDIQSKNPKISGKLEGGKKFKIKSDFKPAGDQPEAIKKLVYGANKDEFNQLMKKSSDDMIKLAANIETATDVKQSLNNMMWANCKACHSKFRAPH